MPRAEDYEHQPIEQICLEWTAKANDPRFQRGQFLGQERLLHLDIAVHPNDSGRIIINYPGHGGHIDGFNDKHRKLAQYMQGEGLGAVVRSKGPGFADFNGFTDDTILRKLIEHSLENAQTICGTENPELLLIGTSAGGGAATAIAHEYESVMRMLLMAPGSNVGMKAIIEGLQQFTGEICIVIGKQDEVVGATAGSAFYNLATRASRRKLFILQNCDHQFRGEQNGRYMSQAPFYAFAIARRPNFPDPEGGMVLY